MEKISISEPEPEAQKYGLPMGLKEVSHVELGSFWLRAKLLGRLSARL
jgi:hypothetical protein